MICRLKTNNFEILCPKYLCIVSIHLEARHRPREHSAGRAARAGLCVNVFLRVRTMDTNCVL